MEDYFDTNRALWDGWTKLHTASAFYDVDGFKSLFMKFCGRRARGIFCPSTDDFLGS